MKDHMDFLSTPSSHYHIKLEGSESEEELKEIGVMNQIIDLKKEVYGIDLELRRMDIAELARRGDR